MSDLGTGSRADHRATVQVREARPADADRIVELVHLAYRTEGGWTTETHLVAGSRVERPEVEDAIADPEHLVLVAEKDGHVVGTSYSHRHGDAAEFGLFAVDPALQGAGLGGRLLEEQAERRAAEGLRALDLRVLQEREDLIAYYERHGFTRTGEIVPFAGRIEDLKVPGLRMEMMVRPIGRSSLRSTDSSHTLGI